MKKIVYISGTVLASGALMATAITPAFALGLGVKADINATVSTNNTSIQTSAQANAAATTSAARAVKAALKLDARTAQAKKKGDEEIARRVANLNELIARIQSMVRVSASEKATLTSNIQAQITSLNSLQAKIDADADVDTLKADMKSITQSYRVYALVMPQGRIVAAADRVTNIVTTMQGLSAKIQARIAEAQAAGKNVATLQASLSDYNAKVTDAASQAQAASAEVSVLVPDQGDKAKVAANEKTIKDAQAKIKVAQQDLKTAQKDAQAIVKAIKDIKLPSVHATSSVSVTATASSTNQ